MFPKSKPETTGS